MALSTTTASELTAEQVATVLTQPLEQESRFLAAVPAGNIIDTPGPLRVPKLPSSKADELQWVGENEKIPEIEHDFDELRLLESSIKSIKTLTRFSNELGRQAVVSIDAALQARLVADVAAKVDAQFLSDQGDGITTPRGLFAQTGTQSVAVGGAFTIDHVLEAQGLALAANVNTESMALFVDAGTYMAMRAQKDSDGRYLVQPDVTAGGLVSPVLGAQVLISNRVPAGQAALVDMSKVIVARDVAPAVKLLDQTFGDYDQLALRVVTRLDMGLTAPEAAVIFDGIEAA